MPKYSFHKNSDDSILERRIPVDDFYTELRIYSIDIEPFEQRYLIHNIEVVIEETDIRYPFTISQLFYNPKAAASTLFFRNGGQNYASIKLPPGNKYVRFVLNVSLAVEPFVLELNCDYH